MLVNLSSLLDSFPLISLTILSLVFVFWDKAVLVEDDLFVPIEF